MARITVEGLKLGYNEHGSGGGAAVVFLHGVGSDKGLWQAQLEYFSARGRRALALDYPGYGESDLAPHALTRPEIARYLWGALDALGVDEAHVVGLSMGGVVALEMRRQQPARLRSLVLADTFARHPDADLFVARAEHVVATLSMAEFADSRAPLVLRPNAPAELVRAVRENMSRIDQRSYRWATVAVWTADYLDDLARVQTPTLVLVGEHDALTPRALSEELAAGIAGARLICLPDAGHLSNVDQPDAFNRAVGELIEEVEGTRGNDERGTMNAE